MKALFCDHAFLQNDRILLVCFARPSPTAASPEMAPRGFTPSYTSSPLYGGDPLLQTCARGGGEGQGDDSRPTDSRNQRWLLILQICIYCLSEPQDFQIPVFPKRLPDLHCLCTQFRRVSSSGIPVMCPTTDKPSSRCARPSGIPPSDRPWRGRLPCSAHHLLRSQSCSHRRHNSPPHPDNPATIFAHISKICHILSSGPLFTSTTWSPILSQCFARKKANLCRFSYSKAAIIKFAIFLTYFIPRRFAPDVFLHVQKPQNSSLRKNLGLPKNIFFEVFFAHGMFSFIPGSLKGRSFTRTMCDHFEFSRWMYSQVSASK